MLYADVWRFLTYDPRDARYTVLRGRRTVIIGKSLLVRENTLHFSKAGRVIQHMRHI